MLQNDEPEWNGGRRRAVYGYIKLHVRTRKPQRRPARTHKLESARRTPYAVLCEK